MVKVKSWLFTEVRGKVKKAEFRRRKNKVTELSQKRIPFNPRTPAQQEVRKAYGQCVEEWNKLSESEKREWRIVGTLLGISGYNAFMRECISEKLGAVWYEITIDNSANSNDLTDYQILLEIVNDSTFFEDCKNEQKYLEFYDTDKATLLNHFVEEFDTTNKNAKIWIKVPSIPANASKTIYLKINTRRTEDLSNPDAVFDLYDDFLGDALDTNKWEVVAGTQYQVADGLLKITNTDVKILSIKTFSENVMLELLIKCVSRAKDGYTAGGFWKSTTDGISYLLHEARDYIRNDDTWNGLADILVPSNVWCKLIFTAYFDGTSHTVNIKAIRLDTNEVVYEGDWSNTVSDEKVLLSRRADDGYTGEAYEGYWDWIRVRKYTKPEPTVSYSKA